MSVLILLKMVYESCKASVCHSYCKYLIRFFDSTDWLERCLFMTWLFVSACVYVCLCVAHLACSCGTSWLCQINCTKKMFMLDQTRNVEATEL